jgi:hypothetical protein
MGHADIATTMIYVHHVPQIDPADKLSQLVTEAQNAVPGHVRDTVAERRETGNGDILQFPAPSEWARLDSNTPANRRSLWPRTAPGQHHASACGQF